jgi:DNA end-binding protein Ku
MVPRANWKGFLRLSLVTCPVALFPATSDAEKISFNQINRKTGHRIKYSKVDTGDEVSSDDIIKGYKVDTDKYLEVSKDELENIALRPARSRSTSLCRGRKSTTSIWCGRITSCPTGRSAMTPMP